MPLLLCMLLTVLSLLHIVFFVMTAPRKSGVFMNTTVVDAGEGHGCLLESYSSHVVNSFVIHQGLFVRTTIKLCCTINPTVVLNIHFS